VQLATEPHGPAEAAPQSTSAGALWMRAKLSAKGMVAQADRQAGVAGDGGEPPNSEHTDVDEDVERPVQRRMSGLRNFRLASNLALRRAHAMSHMVVVLDKDLFRAEASAPLVQEMCSWMAARKHIVVLRLADEEAGGCDSARMVVSTPDELIGAGLFHQEPMAWYEGEHKEVCFSRLAVALGAKERRRSSSFFRQALPFLGGSHGARAAKTVETAMEPSSLASPRKLPAQAKVKARAESTFAREYAHEEL